MNATTATSSSNNQRLRVAVAGASGRMGRMLIEAIAQSDDLALAAALDRADSPSLGTDPSAFLGQPSGIAIESDVRAALSKADCLIDFTRPEGTMDHLAICAELGVKLVIGTTGFSDEEKADRKSTRLNSSHLVISYAVFCLKKKKKQTKSLLTNSILRHNTRYH